MKRSFSHSEFGYVFAYTATISKAMTKWGLPLDPAHRIGLETSLTEFLIVVGSVITEEEEGWAEF